MNTIEAMNLGVEALKNSKEMIVMTQEMGIRFGVSAQKLKLGEVLIQDRAIAALEQAIKQEDQLSWQQAAFRIGEKLASVGPNNYYKMTPQEWLDWAVQQAKTEPSPVNIYFSGLSEPSAKD